MLLVKLFLITLLCRLSSTYRVLLLFPIPGKSHAMLGEGYVRHLLDAGHEVTCITGVKFKNSNSRLRQIDVSSNYALMPLEEWFNVAEIIEAGESFDVISQNLYRLTDFAYSTIMHPNVQWIIQDTSEHFDIVIAEWFFSELYSGLSTVFNCPFIWSSSIEPHSRVLELIDDVLNPAYNPSYRSDIVPPYNFTHRVRELWSILVLKLHKWWLRSTEDIYFANAFALSVEKRGRILPSYEEVRYNASLIFGNSNVASGIPIRLPQNYIAIGGYHIKDRIDPLPVHIQTILDGAQNGFIYFSLGSMVKSSSIPNKMKKGLIDTFRKLNNTILWKFEEEVADLPENVYTVSWAPQVGVLAHPNCKLFITHGGLLSIMEAIHFGVPIIGIPLFGDQNLNVNRAVKKGFGKKLNFNNDIGIDMLAAIKEILNNDRYVKFANLHLGRVVDYTLYPLPRETHCLTVEQFKNSTHSNIVKINNTAQKARYNLRFGQIYINEPLEQRLFLWYSVLHAFRFYKKIEEYSFIYHDRVTPPGELLNHWVSHVVRTQGALHLRSPALLVPWYQKLYFDLAVVIIITSFVAWKIFLKAFNKIVLLMRKSCSSKQKIL